MAEGCQLISVVQNSHKQIAHPIHLIIVASRSEIIPFRQLSNQFSSSVFVHKKRCAYNLWLIFPAICVIKIKEERKKKNNDIQGQNRILFLCV